MNPGDAQPATQNEHGQIGRERATLEKAVVNLREVVAELRINLEPIRFGAPTTDVDGDCERFQLCELAGFLREQHEEVNQATVLLEGLLREIQL